MKFPRRTARKILPDFEKLLIAAHSLCAVLCALVSSSTFENPLSTNEKWPTVDQVEVL